VIEFGSNLDEVARRFARARAIARQRLLGCAEQLHRTGIDGGGTQPFQQLRGQVPTLCRLSHVVAQRMSVITVGGDRGQRAALFAEVEPRVVHLRQHRLPTCHAVQERCLQRGRPAGQAQQADAPHGLDQARIERCMVGHVTVQRRGRFHGRTIAPCCVRRCAPPPEHRLGRYRK